MDLTEEEMITINEPRVTYSRPTSEPSFFFSNDGENFFFEIEAWFDEMIMSRTNKYKDQFEPTVAKDNYLMSIDGSIIFLKKLRDDGTISDTWSKFDASNPKRITPPLLNLYNAYLDYILLKEINTIE